MICAGSVDNPSYSPTTERVSGITEKCMCVMQPPCWFEELNHVFTVNIREKNLNFV